MPSFVVSGEFITEFARTRVLEREWDSAIEILTNLHGITMDQIFSILRAQTKLVGDSTTGINIEPEVDCPEVQDYHEQLRWLYSGVWRHQGSFWEPYAIVTSWGREDMIASVGASIPFAPGGEKAFVHSSLHYADSGSDIATVEKTPDHWESPNTKTVDVLWRKLPSFPFLLIPPSHTSSEAFALFINTEKMIEERGYDFRYRQKNNDVFRAVPTVVDRARSTIDEFERDGWEKAEFFEQQRRQEQLEIYRKQIAEQAGDKWLEVSYIPDTYDSDNQPITVRIPQAPFENWSLWRGDAANMALPWETVCPQGLKMMGDDPYHTDFMVGAGLALDAMRDPESPLARAIWDLREKVQQQKFNATCAVLSGTGRTGALRVVHAKKNQELTADDVAIIPNAGPDYIIPAQTAGAIITERGGEMAHLVSIAREGGLRIVRVVDARKLYPEGTELIVDCKQGTVSIPYDKQEYKMLLF